MSQRVTALEQEIERLTDGADLENVSLLKTSHVIYMWLLEIGNVFCVSLSLISSFLLHRSWDEKSSTWSLSWRGRSVRAPPMWPKSERWALCWRHSETLYPDPAAVQSNLMDYISRFRLTILSCDHIFFLTTLLHQLINHIDISFVFVMLPWTRHLQSPNKHIISHLISAQRSVDWIADQTWWLIYRGYQTEWGAEFGKRSPSSRWPSASCHWVILSVEEAPHP